MSELERVQRRLEMLEWELSGLPDRVSEALEEGNQQRLTDLQRLSYMLPKRIEQQRRMIARLLLSDEM